MRAAIYCRISLDRTGEGLGVTRQLEDCRSLAASLGWDVVEVYTDNDISATSGKPRPEYRRMLTGLQDGTVEALVAWHPDRLYRRALDLSELVDICKTRNIKVATVRAGEVDLNSPTGLLVAEMLAAINMYEVRHKAERWNRAIRQRREEGRMPHSGPRMYGWTRDGNIEPHEAKVIRWFAKELLAGTSIHQLAVKANARGYRTTPGNQWQMQTLSRLLTNPRLAGHSVLKGEIVGVGQWDPILDPETWETVRALARPGKKRGGSLPRVALLAGMIYCGDCGARVVTGQRTKKNGDPQRVYRCTRVVGTNIGCGKVSAHAEPVEEVVEAYAKALLDDQRVRDRVAALAAGTDTGAAAVEAAGLEERITELEQSLDDPGMSVQALLRAIDRSKARLLELQTQLAATRQPVVLPDRGTPWPEDLGRRRRLVAVALEGRKVYLDRVTKHGGKFDPRRVRIEDPD